MLNLPRFVKLRALIHMLYRLSLIGTGLITSHFISSLHSVTLGGVKSTFILLVFFILSSVHLVLRHAMYWYL